MPIDMNDIIYKPVKGAERYSTHHIDINTIMMKNPFRMTLYFLCLVGFVFLLSMFVNHASADEIIVDVSGNGDFTSIQEAIDSSSNGDTIRIWSGTYDEKVIINRSCSLIGNGSALSIINGSFSNAIVEVAADNVQITNLALMNNRHFSYTTGIIAWNINFLVIEDCVISGNIRSLSIYNASDVTISRNQIISVGAGIDLSSSHNTTICMNNIEKCDYILSPEHYLYAVNIVLCTETNIFNNTIYSDSGFHLYQSSYVNISGNSGNQGINIDYRGLTDLDTLMIDATNLVNGKPVICLIGENRFNIPANAGQVVLIKCNDGTVSNLNLSCNNPLQLIQSTGCKVSHNKISSPFGGLILDNCSRITMSNNLIKGYDANLGFNLILFNSHNNIIIRNQFEGCWVSITGENNDVYHNNFIDCFNFYHWGSSCRFNLPYPGGGNFYNHIELIDEFSGSDQTGDGPDGFVDESFIKQTWMDSYPLMEPVNISVEEEVSTENGNASLLIIVAGLAGAAVIAVVIWAWRRRPR